MSNKPQAGDHQAGLGTEQWCLAPLPLPTGYIAAPQQLDMANATPTTLDLGKTSYWHWDFAIRLQFGCCIALFFALLLCQALITYIKLDFSPSLIDAIWSAAEGTFPYYIYCIGGSFLFFLVINIYTFFEQKGRTPIRFNREKRQVYLVVNQKQHVIGQWEEVIAIAETALQVTPYSANETASLALQLPDPATGKVATLAMGYGADILAICEWEAIRTFMEEGLDSLKQKAQTADQINKLPPEPADLAKRPRRERAEYYQELARGFPAGSLAHFRLIRKADKILNGSLSFYFFVYLFSGWTIPCYIAYLLNLIPRAARPKAMRAWSQPIPQDQWAKPSAELLAQSEIMQASYAAGITFKQHFSQPNPKRTTSSKKTKNRDKL